MIFKLQLYQPAAAKLLKGGYELPSLDSDPNSHKYQGYSQ